MPRIIVSLLGLLVCALVFTAGTLAAAPASLMVLAASDLAFAFRDIVPRFEQASGARVTLVLGSTGNFAKQVASGITADVFFAADERFIDELVAAGHIVKESRALYAQGQIVLATRKGFGATLGDLRGLPDPKVRRVAIANPTHAPYGRAAEEALRSLGLWEELRPKLVYGENIRHALQFVQTGSVDAGIVARSIADVPEIEWVPIDAELHRPLNQAVGILRKSPHPDLAHAFIQFVNGPAGRPIMKRYGFLVPGEF